MGKKVGKQGKWSKRLPSDSIIAYAIDQGDPDRDRRLADYIRPCTPRRQWMDETPQRYAYRCIPMTAANTMGWEILNPYACEITWNGGSQVADTSIRIDGIPDDSEGIGGLPKSHFGSGIVTWDLPFIFRTPPGVGLIVTGPPNMSRRGAAPLEGFVETDWLPNGFTMNWKMTEPGFTVRYPADEPICRIFPYKNDYIENFQISILSPDEDPAFMERVIAWRADRLVRLKSKDTAPTTDPRIIWSGDYVKGTDTSGNVHAGHKNVFRCRPVKDRRKK